MRIEIIVHPNSKKPRIQPDLLNKLHIYVSEPPLENRANLAVIEALAKHFKTKKSLVHLITGSKSRIKLFEVNKA